MHVLAHPQDHLQTRIDELEKLNTNIIQRVQRRRSVSKSKVVLQITPAGESSDEEEKPRAPAFPWARMFLYIGIALLVASVVAIAVAVAIAQRTCIRVDTAVL